MGRCAALALVVLTLGPLVACHQIHGPHVSVLRLADLPRPLPSPYDEAATPEQVTSRIDAALARAHTGGKRVIVDLGGNWCSWCRALAGVMTLPEVKPFVDANFEVVPVDISSAEGKQDLNAEVLRRFGVGKVEGVPWLVVAEPDGKVVASSDAVTDDSHHTPQRMVDWLAEYAKRSPAR
jgi:thiol:disulfide interchange protein